jgi:hypothetical protein
MRRMRHVDQTDRLFQAFTNEAQRALDRRSGHPLHGLEPTPSSTERETRGEPLLDKVGSALGAATWREAR